MKDKNVTWQPELIKIARKVSSDSKNIGHSNISVHVDCCCLCLFFVCLFDYLGSNLFFYIDL